MIVVVESNFVLELALRQDEVGECERLIEMARQKAIALVVPACSLFEPYETVIRRRKQRERIAESLRNELRELARCEAYANLSHTSQSVTRALAESAEQQATSLEKSIDRLLQIATVIPLNTDVLRYGQALQLVFDLSPQDCVVLSSVERFLKEQGDEPKVFATKNSRDFLTDPIESYLQQYRCKLLATFADTRQYVEHIIVKQAPAMKPKA